MYQETHSVGGLNGRAVGNGVGEGYAQLDNVRTALLHGENDIRGGLGRGVTGGHIGNKRSLHHHLG